MTTAIVGWLPHPATRTGECLPPPRDARAASDPVWRMPPRVYTPYAHRRLLRPMAVPAGDASRASTDPPGRMGWRFGRGRPG